MKSETVLPAGSWDAAQSVDRVLIDYDRRHRRRILLTTEGGREVLLDLPQAARLRHGDGLLLGDGGVVLVQARPEHLTEVEAAIVAMAGCEIYGRDPRGKLVVVVDSPNAGSLGTTLNNIALLPDVYSASLVFHALDATA